MGWLTKYPPQLENDPRKGRESSEVYALRVIAVVENSLTVELSLTVKFPQSGDGAHRVFNLWLKGVSVLWPVLLREKYPGQP